MDNPIFTIGHGRHPIETFIGFLRQHGIEIVIDIRSSTRSRWPQFNGPTLERILFEHGIGYEHLPECGGRVMAPPKEFARGIERIMELAAETRVVLMCSESHPLITYKRPRTECHRVWLIAPAMRRHGIELEHIMPDGSLRHIDEAKERLHTSL